MTSMYNVAEAMIKDLIVEYCWRKFISLEKLQGRMAIHLDIDFVVDNQEMMSFGYSDSFKTWDCLLSLATG